MRQKDQAWTSVFPISVIRFAKAKSGDPHPVPPDPTVFLTVCPHAFATDRDLQKTEPKT
jgi:hypothetical protein